MEAMIERTQNRRYHSPLVGHVPDRGISRRTLDHFAEIMNVEQHHENTPKTTGTQARPQTIVVRAQSYEHPLSPKKKRLTGPTRPLTRFNKVLFRKIRLIPNSMPPFSNSSYALLNTKYIFSDTEKVDSRPQNIFQDQTAAYS